VKDSQFTVTRTAHRDNSSKYYVNGRVSSFSEVTSLLGGKGIDLDNNRFLILQGEVELISQMKPKATTPSEEGLLEYLEDIIGSNALVEPIAQAAAVVEQLTEQRNEKIKRVQIAEKDKAGLEGSKVEAEAYLTKEREYVRKKGLFLHKTIASSAASVAACEARHTEASARLAQEKAAMASFVGKLDAVEARLEASTKAYGAAAGEQEAVQKAIRALEHEDVKLREQVKAAKAKQRQQEEAILREKGKIEEAHRTITAATAALPALEAAVTRLQAEKTKEEADHDAVMGTLKGETEVLRKQLEAAQAELTPLADAATAAASALATAKTELRLAKESAESASTQLAGLRAKEAQIAADAAAKANEKRVLGADVEKGTARRAVLDKELAASQEVEAAAAEKAKAARVRLEEGKAAMAADGSRGQLVTALSAAAKKGGPLAGAGLHGRLGDLGRIDDRYDVAVTTACAALNWLVVDTTEGGQACVDLLRAKALGRAKFMILDKIAWAAAAMAKPVTTPEGVPRLFDLITPKDDRYRPAFYFALRDTLVAKDMDQATRVAFGKDGARWRVVTLNGEVIETTGAMSGGGKTVRKGGMTSSFAPALSGEELAALEKEAAAAAASVADIRARRAALAKEAADMDKVLPRVAQRLPKLDMELAALAKMAEDVGAQVQAQAAALAKSGGGQASAADAKAIAELGAKVRTHEAASAAAQAGAAQLEGRVADLKRRIVEVGGEKVARAKARLDRASEALEKSIKEVTKARSDLKAAEKAAEKAGSAGEKAVEEYNAAKTEFDALKARIAPLDEEALRLIDKLKSAQAAVAEKEGDVAKLRGEMEAIAREVKVLRDRESELATAVSENEGHLAGHKKRLADLQRVLGELAADYAARMTEYVDDVMAAMAEAGEEIGDVDGEAGEGAGAGAGAGTEAEAAEAEAGAGAGGGVPAKGGRGGRKAAKDKEKDAGGAGGSGGGSSGDAPKRPSIPSRVLERISEPLVLPTPTADQLAAVSVEALEAALNMLKAEREELGKKANLSAIKEYRCVEDWGRGAAARPVHDCAAGAWTLTPCFPPSPFPSSPPPSPRSAKEKDYLRRVAELEAVAKAREEARKSFEGLRKKRLDMFMSGFSVITLRLKEMYQMITLGGDAELELVDSLDPFAEGIVFSVRPPKKSWKNISNLSGGEKTLSSLALVFALHHFKPTPLYVMDEIDAALDFKNVSIVANYIKVRGWGGTGGRVLCCVCVLLLVVPSQRPSHHAAPPLINLLQERTKDAQFIIISLRNNMFELADRLVGIYKTKDVTKSVTINPKVVAAAASVSAGINAGAPGAGSVAGTAGAGTSGL
jgi:structural maintenance of chromosome 4